MKIMAIWDRHKIAPKSRTILILTSQNQLLEFYPVDKYIGKDENNNSLFKDTGDCEYGYAFGENMEFDFKKAYYFAYHFGFSLIKQFGG